MSLSEQPSEWSPTSVQVTVLQARGLRTKGKNGTNDAYALLQVAKEKRATGVAEKCVVPVWNEEVTFDLPPPRPSGDAERCALRVQVLHRALVGPDKLLGQAVINLQELSADRSRDKSEWFKLLDKMGKADKERGEVLLDIQFMRNNMTASMFDLSTAGKSRSRLGKFKDKVRGKKKEDAAPTVAPPLTQVLTDSEEEGNEDGMGPAAKDERKKKHKMSLFSTKSNLQKNMSQSMSVLPAKNSSLSGSQTSGLNMDVEGKKKFKFKIHKRSGSSESQNTLTILGQTKHGRSPSSEQSNMCINGSHVYCEEPQPRKPRVSSSGSVTTSGHGSMEDVHSVQVPEGSSASSSLRSVRQFSSWTEEETPKAQNISEEEDKMFPVEQEKRIEEEKAEEDRKMQEEEERVGKEKYDKLLEERQRREEEERAKEEEKRERERLEELRIEAQIKEEEERARKEKEHNRLLEEKRRLEEERRSEQDKIKRERAEEEERKERERLAEERRKLEEAQLKREEERKQEEERARKEKEEYERLLEEKRLEVEERRRTEEDKIRRAEEERERLAEEKRRKEEERMEKERLRREEEERAQEEKKRRERERMEQKRMEEANLKREEERIRMEEERARKEKEEYERLLEEKRLEVEERRRTEEDKIRRAEEERERLAEEKRRKEEERMEKERLRREEERARKEKEEYDRRLEEKMRLEEAERFRVEEEKIRRERAEEERERLAEEQRQREKMEKERLRQEEERARRQEENERLAEEKRRLEEEEKRRLEEEEKRRLEEEEKRRLEEEEKRRLEERVQREEEERIREQERKEKEEYERLAEEKRRVEEEERRQVIEEERIQRAELMRREEEERMRKEKEEEKRRLEEEERRNAEEERIRKEEMERLAQEKQKIEEEKIRKEEEARKLAKEKLTEGGARSQTLAQRRRNADQRAALSGGSHPLPGQKSTQAAEKGSLAGNVCTNPFEEDFSNNAFEENHSSPVGPDGSTVQQRFHAAGSLGHMKLNDSAEEKDLPGTQREKRPAPQPPGKSQPEPCESTPHVAQMNKVSKDKDVKTASIGPQRVVQKIAPLNRSSTDTEKGRSSKQPENIPSNSGTSKAAKHGKRPAPSKPHEGPFSESKPASLPDGNRITGNNSNARSSEEEPVPVVYGLNPFEEDDYDEFTPQDDVTPSGNAASMKWPPARPQTPDEDAASLAKLKSSKIARAPQPPVNKAAPPSASTNLNFGQNHGAGLTVPVTNTIKGRDQEPEATSSVPEPEVPVRQSHPAEINAEETGRKRDGPPSTSRRLQPVKPLNPLELQTPSVNPGGNEKKSTQILNAQRKTEVNGGEPKGPYALLTREELIGLLLKQESQLSDGDKKIAELEQYIDNLLVRIMEEKPSILMALNSAKKAL